MAEEENKTKKNKEKKDRKKEKKHTSSKRPRETSDQPASIAENISMTPSEQQVVETQQLQPRATGTTVAVLEPDASKKEARRQRRQEREALLEQVPKVDEHGIAYTKQQIRRMRKRVARGLDPVETPAEQHARRQQEAELRRQEEAELAGMILAAEPSPRSGAGRRDSNGDRPENNDDGDEVVQETLDPSHEDEPETEESETEKDPFSYEKKRGRNPQDSQQQQQQQPPPKKTKRRAKEVPSDYICSACQNQHQPVHWIYDCPDKRTVRGANQVSKRQRGLHDPSDCKIFVSGLPFDCTPSQVVSLFAEGTSSLVVKQCKLVKFPDTGRCKGQAYLTLASAEDAQAALKLNGTTVPNTVGTDTAERKKQPSHPQQQPRKELKLNVSKVLSRYQTKLQKK